MANDDTHGDHPVARDGLDDDRHADHQPSTSSPRCAGRR
jgi:hypothetical protein